MSTVMSGVGVRGGMLTLLLCWEGWIGENLDRKGVRNTSFQAVQGM
jgi:hypothetical protein